MNTGIWAFVSLFWSKHISRLGSHEQREGTEMPEFKCKDLGMDCPFEAKAWTRGSLMKKISQHAADAHNMKDISPDMLTKIKAAIK